jgi:uncharacterized protein (TIGR00369 family)
MDLNNHPLILAYKKYNEFGRTINMDFLIYELGKVDYFLTIDEKHLAIPTNAHGGVLAALMDASVGVAALSAVCAEWQVVSTVQMNCLFLNPVFISDQLKASSIVKRKGKRLIFVDTEVVNQKGICVASATAVLNAYPADKAGMS